MPIVPGTRLHHYEIVAPLGAGGTSELRIVLNWTAELQRLLPSR